MTIPALPLLPELRGRSRGRRPALLALAAFVLPICPGLLLAQAPNGSAFGERLTLNVAPLLGSPVVAQSGALPLASGDSYSSFSDSRQAGSLLVSTAATGSVLETGLLLASTQGNGTGVQSASSVEQTQLHLASLLALQADAIESQAQLAGCGCPASGSTRLVNVSLRALGLPISIPINAAPNTVLVDLAGIRVVLNEQISTSARGMQSLTVNAIHVSVNALAGIGLLSGDVVLSQSRAQVRCLDISG